jgi:hypothetical protein
MVKAIEEGMIERKLDKDKRDTEEKEEGDELIKVSAESVELAEEEEDAEIEKGKKPARPRIKPGVIPPVGEEGTDAGKKVKKPVARSGRSR